MKHVRAIDIRLLGKKRTGDESVFFNLTKELLALDRTNEYLLMTDEKRPEAQRALLTRLQCEGQKNVSLVALSGSNRFVWNLVTLPWFLFRHHVDVYHTQYILPFFVPQRTKVVNHIHDVSFRAFPELIGWKDRFFLTLLIPRSLRRAEKIVVPSQFTKDEVIRYFSVPSAKIAVVPNALSEEFLVGECSPEEATSLRERYHLPKRYIVAVGTLQPRKNIPTLIRAVALLQKRLPDIALVLIGNREGHHVDPAIDTAIKECAVTQSVFFPGYVAQEDLPGVIRLASVFAFPSLYEGFGIPLLEAMSQEVPVVASDTPCLREVAGAAALYFDPRSIASCAEKLYTLLTDMEQRASGISQGKDRLSLYSWKKSAQLLDAVYQEARS